MHLIKLSQFDWIKLCHIVSSSRGESIRTSTRAHTSKFTSGCRWMWFVPAPLCSSHTHIYSLRELRTVWLASICCNRFNGLIHGQQLSIDLYTFYNPNPCTHILVLAYGLQMQTRPCLRVTFYLLNFWQSIEFALDMICSSLVCASQMNQQIQSSGAAIIFPFISCFARLTHFIPLLFLHCHMANLKKYLHKMKFHRTRCTTRV